MKKYIITISREFGCGARDIARELSSELGIILYDKDLVDMAAREAKVNLDVFKTTDETVIKKSISGLVKEFEYGSSDAFYSDRAIEAQAKIIRDLANKTEPCIMFGRCSDYILREYPNTISFFLYASMRYRIAHISKAYDLSCLEAEKLIKRVDRQRHNYYKYVTGNNRGDRYGKDMLLDVDSFGEYGCVEIMKEAVRILCEKK